MGNIGHTYIPALLMDSGLPVQIASTVVALSVVVEAPLIFFLGPFYGPLAPASPNFVFLWGFSCSSMSSMLFRCPVFLKVLVTLLAKHTTGMVLIMVSLRFISQQVDKKDLVLAMALVQGVRYLGTILLQPLAAFFCGSRWIFNDELLLGGCPGPRPSTKSLFKDAKRKISRSLWEHEDVKSLGNRVCE